MMNHKYKILFDAYHLYHLPQFDPVIDLLAQDDRFELFLSTSSEIDKGERELALSIMEKRPGKIIKADTEQERSNIIRDLMLDVFICGWSRYKIEKFIPDSTLAGMIYHGIGVKPSYWRDNHERLDIRFVEGEYRIQQLRDYGIQTDLALTGFTKLDPLFHDNNVQDEKLFRALDLDPEKKTILFAPTFYPNSLEKFGMDLGVLTKDYNVILKLHMWAYFMDRFGDINLKPQLRLGYKLAEQYEHIKLVGPEIYNIVHLYKLADILMTDASSTIYEIIALEKPVIVNRFLKLKLSHRIFRSRLYRKRLNEEMDRDISKFCFELQSPKDLTSILETAFKENDKQLNIIRKYQKKMLFKLDGQASVRVRDRILDRLN